jgi:hypothetical protein
VDPLTLTIVLSLFNPYINITSQKFYSTPFYLLFIVLYSSPPCGSTPVLSGYLLLRHSCIWDKTSIFWSCQVFGVIAGEVNSCINYNIYFIFSFLFLVSIIYLFIYLFFIYFLFSLFLYLTFVSFVCFFFFFLLFSSYTCMRVWSRT